MIGRKRGRSIRTRIMPDDFPELAAEMSVPTIKKLWKIGSNGAMQWIKAQTPEWQAHRSLIAGRASNGFCAVACGKHWQQHTRRQAPDNFAEMATGQSENWMRKFFKCSEETLKRWLGEMTPQWQAMHKAACAKAGRDRKATAYARKIVSQAEERQSMKVVNAVNKPLPVNWGFCKPVALAPASSEVALAAQHLQRVHRHIRPICAATVVLGRAGKGFYKYGREMVPEADIIAKARAAGWSPDAWRQLA